MALPPNFPMTYSFRYSSAVRRLNALENGRTSIWSTPMLFRSAFFSSIEVSRRRFLASSCSTLRGCGQNVTTMLSSPRAAASSTRVRKIKRCPRWTPSKNPVATTILQVRNLVCEAKADSSDISWLLPDTFRNVQEGWMSGISPHRPWPQRY